MRLTPVASGVQAPGLGDLVRAHGGVLFAVHPNGAGDGLVSLDDPRLGVRPGDVQVHSGSASEGDLFVALPGLAADGVRFAPDAIRRGAAAVLMSPERSLDELRARCAGLPATDAMLWLHPRARELAGLVASDVHGRPTEHLGVAGVTGTNGKTSVCHLASQLLGSAGLRPALLGTAGHVLHGARGPLHLTARNTTPDATEVHRLLARHRAAGGDTAVMEVSSHGLAQARLSGVRLRVGAFTNLTRDHLDYHRTMERYLAAKARIWGQVERGGAAVIVGRDGAAGAMRSAAVDRGLEVSQVLIEPDGGASGAGEHDLVARNLSYSARGARFELTGRGIEREPVLLPLRGAHNVENALVAAAIARHLGADPETVVAGLGRISAAPGRLEPVEIPWADLPGAGGVDDGGRPDVLVDYAHSPDALERVLVALRDELEADSTRTRRRLICVFGCGGDRDKGKRETMGFVAGRFADVAIVTSDNPRSEDPGTIADAVALGVERAEGRRIVELDRRAAIDRAIEIARPGDMVLIAGKGHENTQTIGATALPFDDRVVATEALYARFGVASRSRPLAARGGSR